MSTLRMALHIAAVRDYNITQIDVSTAFLYGDIDVKLTHTYSHNFCKVVSFIVFRLSRAQMAATDADGPSVRPLARGRLAT